MARPIEATPVLTGKEAEKLLKQLEKPVVIDQAKEKELASYRSVYQHFLLNRKLVSQ